LWIGWVHGGDERGVSRSTTDYTDNTDKDRKSVSPHQDQGLFLG
jgi:hypothetical protein